MDWTKSTGHMLSGRKIFDSYEEEFVLEPEITVAGHRLGGESSSLASARALSGAAAYQRFLNASANVDHASGTKIEYSSDDVPRGFVHETVKVEPDPDYAMHVDSAAGLSFAGQHTIGYSDPNPDDVGKQSFDRCLEPDPDDSSNANNLNQELRFDVRHHSEPDPDDGSNEVPEHGNTMEMDSELTNHITVVKYELDLADSSNANQELIIDGKHGEEPDPDDTCQDVLKSGNGTEMITEQSGNSMVLKAEPDPDDHVGDSNINELQRVEEPVRALCSRLQKSIKMLRLQATPVEAESAIQTLFKIIKNVIEHPNDIKYKRLRKVYLFVLVFHYPCIL